MYHCEASVVTNVFIRLDVSIRYGDGRLCPWLMVPDENRGIMRDAPEDETGAVVSDFIPIHSDVSLRAGGYCPCHQPQGIALRWITTCPALWREILVVVVTLYPRENTKLLQQCERTWTLKITEHSKQLCFVLLIHGPVCI